MLQESPYWNRLSDEPGRRGGKPQSPAFPVPSARLTDGNFPSDILDKFRRIRQGIADRKAIRIRDVDRLRALGVHPFGRCRVFRVAAGGDEIVAVWCKPDREHAVPHWSEITRSLEEMERAVDRAAVTRE